MEQAKVSLENVLIITDDLALPLGKIRIRKKGSDGGHNGLKSINDILASQAYARMRFGVGDDFPKGKQVDFVLGEWTSEEEKIIGPKVSKAVDAIKAFGTMDLNFVMTNFNKD
jgi:PTH1 family peptidyl-tRNA hydrolase